MARRRRRRRSRRGRWIGLLIAPLAVGVAVWVMWKLSRPIDTVEPVRFPTAVIRVTPLATPEIEPGERERLEEILRRQGKIGSDAPDQRRQRTAPGAGADSRTNR